MSGTEQFFLLTCGMVCCRVKNMLLDLWQEKIEELRGARKNSHVYQEIAAKLHEAGFCGSWADVRTKVDNLTRKYRQEKAKMGPTGGAPSSWEHFQKVNNILGSFRLHNIQETMNESTDMSTLLNISEDIIEFDPLNADDNQPTCSWAQSDTDDNQRSQPKKKRKSDVNAELVKLAKERNAMQRQMYEGRKQQMNEIVQRLETNSSQNASFQSELLSILREK